jgi:hypothetical protein
MNIANYITDSATAAQRLTAEATLPPLREGYSRTQALLDHIADTGPISTADLCKALNITNRQVWGMLKYPLQTGKVIHERGMWARTAQEVVDWQAAIDEAVIAKEEADAVALLTRRGWTCVKREANKQDVTGAHCGSPGWLGYAGCCNNRVDTAAGQDHDSFPG